ncbi:hypothetical protein B0H10DRAFT_1971890 [Mycena sp. CBHHK59/15]|nr:hypothetical protein B0H10DRAFT_1971890 [Mycena sp. CBHHK59/15]
MPAPEHYAQENGPPPSLFARAAPARASINARIVVWSFVAPASQAATRSISFIGYSIGPVPFSGQSAQGTGPVFAARAPQAWAMPQPGGREGFPNYHEVGDGRDSPRLLRVPAHVVMHLAAPLVMDCHQKARLAAVAAKARRQRRRCSASTILFFSPMVLTAANFTEGMRYMAPFATASCRDGRVTRTVRGLSLGWWQTMVDDLMQWAKAQRVQESQDAPPEDQTARPSDAPTLQFDVGHMNTEAMERAAMAKMDRLEVAWVVAGGMSTEAVERNWDNVVSIATDLMREPDRRDMLQEWRMAEQQYMAPWQGHVMRIREMGPGEMRDRLHDHFVDWASQTHQYID